MAVLLTACNDNPSNTAPSSPLTAATATPQSAPSVSSGPATPPVPNSASTLTATSRGTSVSTTLGVPFQLKLNQPQVLVSENLTVEFVKLVADSRCPRNVNCITAGSVTVQISLQKSGQTYNIELTLPGLTQNKQLQNVAGYTVELQDVSPYPGTKGGIVSGSGVPTVNPSDYSATLLISKA